MNKYLNSKSFGHIIFDHDGTLVCTNGHPYYLFDGIKELLTELRQNGFSLYIWTARPRRSVIEITKGLDILENFNELYCYDDGLPKPHPMGLSKLCDGFDKNLILHVGDSLSDIEGAHAFGIEVVAACWNEPKLLDKFQPLANYTASSVDEFRHIIRGKFHV